jgi:hypothetical protein
MSALVLDAIAADIATLPRVVDTPVAPFGYGSDIAMTAEGDLDEDMAELDPFSVAGIAQACLRRLDCARGALADDPDYGISVRSWLLVGVTIETPAMRQAEVQAELTKDDRIASVRAQLTPDPSGRSMTLDVRIVPVDPNLGPFDLTFAITSAAVVLEEIRSAAA